MRLRTQYISSWTFQGLLKGSEAFISEYWFQHLSPQVISTAHQSFVFLSGLLPVDLSFSEALQTRPHGRFITFKWLLLFHYPAWFFQQLPLQGIRWADFLGSLVGQELGLWVRSFVLGSELLSQEFNQLYQHATHLVKRQHSILQARCSSSQSYRVQLPKEQF